MPAILASSFNNQKGHKLRTKQIKRSRKFSRTLSCLEDNISYKSGESSMDDSITSSSSISSFLSQSSSMSNQKILETKNNDWGYFVDVAAKDKQLEQFSEILSNRSRRPHMGLLR